MIKKQFQQYKFFYHLETILANNT